MKWVLRTMGMSIGIFLVAGCCLKFSDQVANTRYHVGDTISTQLSSTGINGGVVNVKVEKFQWGNGNWTTSGSARVDTRNYAAGGGNEINTNNTNLHFLFNYPVKKITLKFADFGGNSNIRINNTFKNIGRMINLNNTVIDGVSIDIIAAHQGNNYVGTMTLEGDIKDFAIGGQELWLDDVCR